MKGLNEGNYFLIIGAQNKESTANYDATMFFMREIWPEVAKINRNIKLRIVGRNPDKSVVDLAAMIPAVKVTGFIEDERDVLEKCMALLVPLRVGGGSRLKIPYGNGNGKTHNFY